MRGSNSLIALGGTIAGALTLLVGGAAAVAVPAPAPAPAAGHITHIAPNQVGGLDCNGFSRVQRSVKLTSLCTDPKGYDGGRFYDNGHYIGHDEPIIRFMSSRDGSGNDITWTEQLPMDPPRQPTVGTPG